MKLHKSYLSWFLITGIFMSVISTSAIAQRRGGSHVSSGGSRPSRGSSAGHSFGGGGIGRPSGVRPGPGRISRPLAVVRPGIGYRRPSVYYRRPIGWNRPYYRPYYHYYGPRIGFRINVLPFGYYPFSYGPDMYYYFGGTFYRQDNDNYKVVTPPVGAEVPNLPKEAAQVTINGQDYYEYNGTYYQQTVNADGKTVYVVAGKDGVLNTDGQDAGSVPQVGEVVDKLPADSREVYIKDQKYYVSPSNVYYEEISDGNKTSYKVVGN